MDRRPIGVFDSGIGGITAVKKITEMLPFEDIIYLGDTLRAPYGVRPVEEIIQFATEEAAFLAKFDIKAMVIACNTICVTSHEILQKLHDVPIYEVIGPAASAAVRSTKNRKIGLIATSATIRSGAYEAAVKKLLPETEVFSAACPRLVPLVESGRCSAEDAEVFAVVEEYLAPLRDAKVDTLILGCTHFPLLSDVISQIMGPAVTLINSGAEVIDRLSEDLQKNDAENPGSNREGTVKYCVTGDVETFAATASQFLGCDVGELVEQVNLESI